MSEAGLPPDRNAFMRLIGAAQVPAPPGKVHMRLPHMREELLNQLPAAHGGVVMTLLDSVMARAAAELPTAPSRTAVTVEMSSRFHRPARGALLAEGTIKEAILATNTTVEGEATAHVIAELAARHQVKSSRIAHGVPVGGELEYVDGGTLAHALAGRQMLST